MTTLEAPNPTTAVNLPRPGSWRIVWRGSEWSEADVTGQHLATLALLTGTDDFDSLDVDPRHGHQRLMQMIMALLCVSRSQGVDDVDAVSDLLAESLDEVAKASVEEILGALRYD